MFNNFVVSGSIPEVVKNEAHVYEGNLIEYARLVFSRATNLGNPYHNFRHMFQVLWLCYDACRYYAPLTPRQKRNLLIAALFHDFDHPGHSGPDELNIDKAIKAFSLYVLDEDKPHFKDIALLIRFTEYPYKVETASLGLSAQILRDADFMQFLSTVWIQQVIFGLASETCKTPLNVLREQVGFIKSLALTTGWAQKLCPPEQIKAKAAECRALLEIFDK